MKPALKWALIIGGILLFFIIIGVILYISKKGSSRPVSEDTTTVEPEPEPTGEPCTKTQIKKKCENKCVNKLLLPFIGFTSYHTCLRDCKATPPEEFKIC